MNITDHVFEETHIAGQSRCVAETLTKVRYRGLAKNTARLYTLFGLANLMIAGRQLGMKHSRIAS